MERESGYYWLKFNGEWDIGYYLGNGEWNICNSESNHDYEFEGRITEISAEQIKNKLTK